MPLILPPSPLTSVFNTLKISIWVRMFHRFWTIGINLTFYNICCNEKYNKIMLLKYDKRFCTNYEATKEIKKG